MKFTKLECPKKSGYLTKIGYFIGEKFQGKGIITRSVRAVLEYCFDSLNINRMELRCAVGNLPSMRVAERLGFTHEGVLRQEEFLNGIFVDQHVYALLSEDFIMPTTLTEAASAISELPATMQ
ncbi:GNAT family N-acetyltransferase [Janthinobacterium sp.]|uniref:GNAT family N-acetyltransferase n=1 Tax=Janthinobacterium sp. TaxID=1871054 RepID=UPI003977D45B